jgi:tryptophan synthase beta chain
MTAGKFGIYGGQFVPETLMYGLAELANSYQRAMQDTVFKEEYSELLQNYAGRPSLLYKADKLSQSLGGATVYLKREDLNHTGSHKINNVLGQALLAKRMGKKKVIAETGAGQHGVATATVAALFGMECEVFMGREDAQRQRLNVFRMELLGAKVTQVESGSATLKEATSEALRVWTARIEDTFYIVGSVVGPHPYPEMVAAFQEIIGEEARRQIFVQHGDLPAAVIACVGGGSNAMGIFRPFIADTTVRLYGAEAGGEGLASGRHAAAIAGGRLGVLHGMKSIFAQDKFGNIAPVHSISAGLDYPGIGPEHAHLASIKRAEYLPVTDAQAIQAFTALSREEGIVAALESSHAVYLGMQLAADLPKSEAVIVNLSGRGDKDVQQIAEHLGVSI